MSDRQQRNPAPPAKVAGPGHGAYAEDPTPKSMPVLYDVPAAARAWSCGERTVWRWIDAGLVRTVKLGRLVRIPTSEIERIAREGIYGPESPIASIEARQRDRSDR